MSLFTLSSPLDFRDAVEAIDQITAEDVTSTSNWYFFQTYTFSIGENLSVKMNVFPYEFFGTGQSTSFVITDEATGEIAGQFTVKGALGFAGGIGLADAIQSISYDSPNYISDDSGAVIEAYDTDDEMLGQGTFFGNGGDDKIELEGSSQTPLGNAEISVAHGGDGDDFIKVGTQNAEVFGGDGDDTILVGFGNVEITGGAGQDSFVFDSGYYDTYGETDVRSDATVRTVINDFNSEEGDTISIGLLDDSGIAAMIADGIVAEGDTFNRFSFGSADETLADWSTTSHGSSSDNVWVGTTYYEDDLFLSTVIYRQGEDFIISEGTVRDDATFDEEIVIRGLTPDQIALSDIYFQLYSTETYGLA